MSTGHDEGGPVPEVAFLLDRRDKLRLSERQVASIAKLQSGWEKLYYPKLEAANAAARETGEYLSRGGRGRIAGPPERVQKIEQQAAPVVVLSGEIAAARRRYWAEAMRVLTPEQRAIAAGEREADYVAKRKALKDAVRKRLR